jgi:ABC-2 type transport system permease protein
MLAIFKREITSFFTSPIAYLVIGLFLLFNGLFLWVFRSGFNIFDYGFADLSNFFLLTPWILIFLIPAITMKSFSEERRLGTIELLFIKPISLLQIITGKFMASIGLILITLLPTLLYTYSIGQLGAIPWNMDLGMALGSYFGLLFLVAGYAAIGIFSSTITDNQIVAFIVGLILCFIFYYGFEALATLFSHGDLVLFIRSLGMKARVESMARGVLDTRDIVYFLSVACFFLFLSVIQLKTLKR